MMQDARLAVGVFDHPKTKLLRRLGGSEAVLCLFRLWLWTAQNKPEGFLDGMSDDFIESAADWHGEPGALLGYLIRCRFLDGDAEGSRRLHDWTVHQPWCSGAEARSDRSRYSALVKHHGPEKADEIMRARKRHRKQRKNQPAQRMLPGCGGDAPSPSPLPSPIPAPTHDCPTPENGAEPAPSEPPAIALPCTSGDHYEVPKQQVERWAELFPAVDIMQALRAMLAWLEANPDRRKTLRGAPRFVVRWLAREQDSGRGGRQAASGASGRAGQRENRAEALADSLAAQNRGEGGA